MKGIPTGTRRGIEKPFVNKDAVGVSPGASSGIRIAGSPSGRAPDSCSGSGGSIPPPATT